MVAVRLGLCFAVGCGLWPSWVLADEAAMPVNHAPSNAAVRTSDAGSTMIGVEGARSDVDTPSAGRHLKITTEIDTSRIARLYPPQAASAQILSLGVDEAVTLAMQRGLEIEVSSLDLQSSENQLAAVTHQFSPLLTLAPKIQRNTISGAGATNEVNTDLTGAWKLRNGMVLNATASKSVVLGSSTQLVGVSIPLARDACSALATIDEKDAASALKSSNLSSLQVRQDTIFNCVQAYFGLELARMKVRVDESALERAREIARINVLLEQAGRIPRMMLLQSDLAVTQAQVTLAQSEEDVKVAERALLKSIGISQVSTSGLQIELKDSFLNLTGPTLTTASEAVQEAIAHRFELQAQREGLVVAQRAILRAENDLQFRVDLRMELGRQVASSSAAAGSGSTQSRAIGIAMELPFDRTPQKIALSNTKLNLKKAEIQLAASERDISTEAGEAFNRYEFVKRQVDLAERSVELARVQLDAEVLKVRAGRSSAADLSVAQDNLRQTELSLVQIRFEVFNAGLVLRRAMGTLLSTWAAR